jgi:hypothetical protein
VGSAAEVHADTVSKVLTVTTAIAKFIVGIGSPLAIKICQLPALVSPNLQMFRAGATVPVGTASGASAKL